MTPTQLAWKNHKEFLKEVLPETDRAWEGIKIIETACNAHDNLVDLVKNGRVLSLTFKHHLTDGDRVIEKYDAALAKSKL